MGVKDQRFDGHDTEENDNCSLKSEEMGKDSVLAEDCQCNQNVCKICLRGYLSVIA